MWPEWRRRNLFYIAFTIVILITQRVISSVLIGAKRQRNGLVIIYSSAANQPTNTTVLLLMGLAQQIRVIIVFPGDQPNERHQLSALSVVVVVITTIFVDSRLTIKLLAWPIASQVCSVSHYLQAWKTYAAATTKCRVIEMEPSQRYRSTILWSGGRWW